MEVHILVKNMAGNIQLSGDRNPQNIKDWSGTGYFHIPYSLSHVGRWSEAGPDGQDDVAGFYNSGLGINRNDAAAFFYYNDLHVVMPVKRNLCEVQRDGAQIGIVWKLDADVFFSFMEVFIGKCVHGCV